jgi:sporulation protein YlmC with PRC-barrel domain
MGAGGSEVVTMVSLDHGPWGSLSLRKERSMDIRLGAQVVSSDGEAVGKVTHLVLDPTTRAVVQLIVRRGRLRQDEWIVDRSFVAAIDDDGTIRLSRSRADLEDLPAYVEASYVTPASRGIHLDSYLYGVSVADAFGASRPMLSGGGSGAPLPSRAYTHGQLQGASFEVRSNLADDSLVIATGLDVVSADGEKIGEVKEVNLDGEGKVVGFVMGTGVGNRQPVNVPVAAVETATAKFVRLALASDKVLSGDGGGLVKLSESDLLLEYPGEDVRGRAVQDRAGREIGTVDDLIVDETERRVRLLVVAPLGLFGGQRRKVLVPTAAVTRVEPDFVRIEFDEDRLGRAPVWDPVVVLPEPDVRSIYRYYDISSYWSSGDSDEYLFPRQP